MNIVQRAIYGLKAVAMRWSGSGRSWFYGGLGRTRYDYAGQVNPARNSIVMACVLWIGRTFPEAPLRVRVKRRNGDLEPVPTHPLLDLMRRPTPYYSGDLLWAATLADWVLTGNAYWIKVRNGLGGVLELWWVPSRIVEPKFPDHGGPPFISHYEYTPGAAPIRLDPRDVVHFRYGLDPDNPRKGLSPLASLMREIFTDDEAANFSAALLRNLGVPGVVISPDSDAYEPTQEDLDYVKSEFSARFGGDNRGSALVMKGKTKVEVLSFSPEQMNLRDLRALPEERVSALLGIPAAVVGLGTGLANTKVGATMAEMREQAYESNLIPTYRLMAAEIRAQLLPDFGASDRLEVDFDLSEVRVLQPDLDKKFARLDVAVRGGWMTPNEAREDVGLDPLPDGDVIYLPTSVKPTDPTDLLPAPMPAAPPAALPPGQPDAGDQPEEEAPPVRALPAGKGRVERKAVGHHLAAAVHRLRDRHEAALAQELADHLAQQRGRVLTAMRSRKALSWRDVFDALAETRSLTALLESWYQRLLGDVRFLTEDALGLRIGFDEGTTRAYLREAGREIAGITETTRKAVASALDAAEAAGESIPDAARRLEELAAFSRQRAVTIARTELGHAANLAALTSYRASGVVVGVRVFDGDGCGLASHDDPRKADGVLLRLDEVGSVPTLAHPRCLVAGTVVLAPNLTASFARRFDGEVVVLRTADDDLLTCTPNHPVLTDEGWIAAGALRQGDHVIRCLDGQRVAALLDPHDDHVPARIEQVADACGPASGGTTATMPTAAEDFHGDGCREHVHVVRTKGRARADGQAAAASDPGRELLVVGAHAQLQALAGERAPDLAVERLDASPAGGVGRRDGDGVGRAVAQLHADLLESIADDRVGHAEAGGDLLARLAALVAPSEIVHVERKPFSGHVYNLETAQEWYIAEGIITHNCRRAFGAVIDPTEMEGVA